MEDMKKLFKEVNLNLNKFMKEYPKETKAFVGLMQAIEAPGALDSKQNELIAIALSVVTHCKWCIAWHVEKALEHGASRKEIAEAAWMAVLMGGGPALMYLQLVEKALDDFEKKKKKK